MKTSKSLNSILTKLENEVARDVQLRLTQHRSGRSPKSSHAEALAAIVEAVEGLIPPEQSTREGLDKLSKSDFHIVLSMRQGYNNCRSEMLQAIKEWQ